MEDWHCVEFRVMADGKSPNFKPGTMTHGSIAFYVGAILIAEISLWAQFSSDIHKPQAHLRTDPYDPYQRIFVSYSHKDVRIIEQLERAYTILGFQYLRDVNVLRSGEDWNSALLNKISEADIFQLCWSEAARISDYVEKEWRHAIGLNRSHFIRPMYWEKPMPDPPPELRPIHFAYYPIGEN
jgi:hypothetical protein